MSFVNCLGLSNLITLQLDTANYSADCSVF